MAGSSGWNASAEQAPLFVTLPVLRCQFEHSCITQQAHHDVRVSQLDRDMDPAPTHPLSRTRPAFIDTTTRPAPWRASSYAELGR